MNLNFFFLRGEFDMARRRPYPDSANHEACAGQLSAACPPAPRLGLCPSPALPVARDTREPRTHMARSAAAKNSATMQG